MVGDRLPALCVHEGAWNGRGPEGAPFLSGRLDPRRGPLAEVWLVPAQGVQPARVVLRILHAAMDGRGMLHWATDLLRRVNGQEPLGASAGPTTDLDLARPLIRTPEPPPLRIFAAPTGEAEVCGEGAHWVRVRMQGSASTILPRTVSALWRASRMFTDGPLRVDIPVDLRRHAPDLVSSANLTGILGIDLAQNPSPEDIRHAIAEAVEARAYAGAPIAAAGLRWIPVSLMSRIGLSGARQGFATDSYQASATVSNVGAVDVDALSGAGFRVDRAFFVPPANPGLPLLMVITGGRDGVDLCAAVPGPLATRGRLEALLDGVVEHLGG